MKSIAIICALFISAQAFASYPKALVQSIQRSAQEYEFSDEGTSCGGKLLSFVVTHESRKSVFVEAQITRPVNYCANIQEVTCVGEFSKPNYDGISFECDGVVIGD